MNSIINYGHELPIYCQMQECQWVGHFTEIEEHFEICHPENLRVIRPGSYFKLTFGELRKKYPLLLSTPNGIYWFVQDDENFEYGTISKSIFEIGPSKPVEYFIKLKISSTQQTKMIGPYLSHDLLSNQYDFTMKVDIMSDRPKRIAPSVIILFKEFDIKDDKWRPINFKNQENFICSSCESFVSISAPYFCSNYHPLCEECFETVISSDCPKCEISEYCQRIELD